MAQSERGGVTTADSTPALARLVLGWEEWVALPGLGLPALKAKIDTGAKTSALHAEAIELLGPATERQVRFTVRPAPRRPEIAVVCTAALIDVRIVTSSNGIPEERCVIATALTVGAQTWPIEVTLSDRREMSYRMLLGRQALQAGGVLVDPGVSFRQAKLGFKAYGIRRRKRVG